MNKIDRVINKIVDSRNDWAIMNERRDELAQMVNNHGMEAVAAATGLKESTINQYLRDRAPRISLTAMDQARFVFAHPDYLAAKQS